jgi:hypothetical protein
VYFYSGPTHQRYRASLKVHLLPFGISTAAYFVTIAVIGKNPAKSNDIGKILLWFLPMVLEIFAHFYMTRLDHVKIKTEIISKRSGSLFVVVLGEGRPYGLLCVKHPLITRYWIPGLNQITASFKYVMGTVGFTFRGAGLMASAAIIVVGEFSLYSRNNWKRWDSDRTNRTLLWFFSHYVLMATLILTLQGKVGLVSILPFAYD